MHSRVAALIVLAGLLICSCARSGTSSFERERDSIQRHLPTDARLLRAAPARENGHATEASWECDFPGNAGAAKNTFRKNVPPDYKPVLGSDIDMAYTKYDEHDSFYLTLEFRRTDANSTTVTVLLKSIPD